MLGEERTGGRLSCERREARSAGSTRDPGKIQAKSAWAGREVRQEPWKQRNGQVARQVQLLNGQVAQMANIPYTNKKQVAPTFLQQAAGKALISATDGSLCEHEANKTGAPVSLPYPLSY